jgi:hypothetical protein
MEVVVHVWVVEGFVEIRDRGMFCTHLMDGCRVFKIGDGCGVDRMGQSERDSDD